MSQMSDYLENSLRAHIFRTSSFTKPSVLAVALSSGTPLDSFTGASMLEWANTNNYARQTINPLDANWSADDNVNGNTYNNNVLTFALCASGDGGWVSGICICDSATYGAGNVLVWASAVVPKYYQLNDQVVIPVSGLQFQFR